MKRLYLQIAVFGCFALCACSAQRERQPESYTHVPLVVNGSAIPADSREKYLYDPSVKAYSIGRSVDPVTGQMREATTVYRIEKAPEWNMTAQPNANYEDFLKANGQGKIDPVAGQIATLGAQLGAMVTAQQEIVKANDALLKRLDSIEQRLGKTEESGKKLGNAVNVQTENLQMMTEFMTKMQKRIESLEAK